MKSSPSQLSKIAITPMLFIILLFLASFDHILADLYLPSLPAITKAFNVLPSQGQLTLGVFFLGFSISELFYGPLSDNIGRRRTLLIGICFSIIGTLVCLIAPSMGILILGRLLEGIGAGACRTISKSITRDLKEGVGLSKLLATIVMGTIFFSAAMTIVAGYIQRYYDWRANFLYLFIYTSVVGLLIWKSLPETNVNLNVTRSKFKTALSNYWTILKSRAFLGYALCAGCAFAGLGCYLATTTYLLQNALGMSSVQYGWISFATTAIMFLGALLNIKWVGKQGVSGMVLNATYLIILAGVSMLALAWMGYFNVWVLMVPIAIFFTGFIWISINAVPGSFDAFPEMAGAVGALYGSVQIIGTALGTIIISKFPVTNQVPLAIAFITVGVLALIVRLIFR